MIKMEEESFNGVVFTYTKEEHEYAQNCIRAVDEFKELINKPVFKKEYSKHASKDVKV